MTLSGPDIDNLPDLTGEQMEYLLELLVRQCPTLVRAYSFNGPYETSWFTAMKEAARDMPAIIRDAKKGNR